MLKSVINIFFLNILFGYYSVGDTISIEDQQISAVICFGSHPLDTTLSTFSLSDFNGDLNGGHYGVTMLSIQASW